MIEEASEVKYIGDGKADGVECDRVRLIRRQMDVDLWVSKGDKPILVKAVPDVSKALRAAKKRNPQMRAMKVEMSQQLTDWQPAAKLADDAFEFTPPEGAEKVDSLLGGRRRSIRHGLQGSPAPDFELGRLDGGKVKLSSHKGKQIVLLDFWATWCGPCRTAMPILVRVAKAYRDKGVVLYAVNQDEDPAEIRDFLKGQKLACTVLLDPGSEVGDLYQVSGIPQSVLIDKKGVVQAVHSGISRRFEKQLRKELDTLVSGKSLVEPKEKAAKPKPTVKPRKRTKK